MFLLICWRRMTVCSLMVCLITQKATLPSPPAPQRCRIVLWIVSSKCSWRLRYTDTWCGFVFPTGPFWRKEGPAAIIPLSPHSLQKEAGCNLRLNFKPAGVFCFFVFFAPGLIPEQSEQSEHHVYSESSLSRWTPWKWCVTQRKPPTWGDRPFPPISV